MKNNLYAKVILISVITAMLMYFIVPIVLPSYPSHAITRIQYKVIDMQQINTAEALEKILNKYALEGWELKQIEVIWGSIIFHKMVK